VRPYTEIEKIIQDELELAMANFRETSARFKDVMSNVPSGLPHPDGSLSITQVTEAHKKSIADLQTAVKRHNQFFINKIVPDDLKGE